MGESNTACGLAPHLFGSQLFTSFKLLLGSRRPAPPLAAANFDESQLGPGREMKVSPAEVTKMIIFDILAEDPGLSMPEDDRRIGPILPTFFSG